MQIWIIKNKIVEAGYKYLETKGILQIKKNKEVIFCCCMDDEYLAYKRAYDFLFGG